MMINQLFLFATLLFCISFVKADTKEINAVVPLSVFKVYGYRVREEIIRITTLFGDSDALVHIDRIATPKFKLLESLPIDSITLNTGEHLTFDGDVIAGAFISKVTVKDTTLHLPFEYFPATGDSFFVDCTIEIGETQFSPMDCIRKERPYE